MAEYLSMSLKKYIDDLAAKLPAPGGGSASALVGALGIASLSMACNFTTGKEKYKPVAEEVKQILSKLETLRIKLMNLIQKDIDTYQQFSQVYALPKTTEEEKKIRSEKLQAVLKSAIEVPMEMVRLCREGIEYSKRLVEIGAKNLISDVGCGAIFLLAAIEGAKLNVEINLQNITDKEFVEINYSELNSLIADIVSIKQDIVNRTEQSIKSI